MGRRILVPVDHSPQSRGALDYALEAYPDAEIRALHVLPPAGKLYGTDDEYLIAEELTERNREQGERILETARQTARERGAEIVTELRTGDPAHTIKNYATTHDIDHIVIGSHGREGVSRILLGSVAEKVIRNAAVPVTVIR